MEPVCERNATVNDLLDRLLDKGVVLQLEMVIGIAGIPLIGVNLRAAIAAIETMIEYGLMEAWDEKTRSYAERELQHKKLSYAAGEGTLLEVFGAHWYSHGIYRAWRPGRLHLTDRRLILYRKMPAQVLFETTLERIRGVAVDESVHFNAQRVPLLQLVLDSGEEVSLYVQEVYELEAALRDRLAVLGVALSETIDPHRRDRAVAEAAPDARVLAEGRMWRRSADDAAGPVSHAGGWEPGWLYLTDKGLLWWSEGGQQVAASIAVESVIGVAAPAQRDVQSHVPGGKPVLSIRHRVEGRHEVTLFAGEFVDDWRRATRQLVLDREEEGLP